MMWGILSMIFLCTVELLLAGAAIKEREKHSYWE